MDTKIKCRQARGKRGGTTTEFVPWKKAKPFSMSEVGILIHRVHSVRTYLHKDRPHHTHADYWCSNGTNQPLFFDVPLKDRLVCARCEAIAVANGEPSSDAIAGHHVHIGELRAKRLCCPNDDN